MIQVNAPTRLHFGLLCLPNPELSESVEVDGPRSFGGAGLMIQEPRVIVQVRRAHTWQAKGPSATRALQFAKAAASDALGAGQCFDIEVLDCPAEHTGLGVGTQLGLATAAAVRRALGEGRVGPKYLAALVGRGERSAVGVRGFGEGGFLIDGGKRPGQPIGTILARYEFPTEWPILLVRPNVPGDWFGAKEASAFQRARTQDAATQSRMAELLLFGMMPAVLERDYAAFAEPLHQYNWLAGQPFAADQGGPYAHPELTRLVAWVRAAGVAAVGQSSWGPTCFAILPSRAEAETLAAELRATFPGVNVIRTTADNGGAVLTQDPDETGG